MEIDYVSVEVMEIDQAVFTVREVPSWARPIMDFLVDGQVPTNEDEDYEEIQRIYHHQQGNIQEKCHRSTAEMC
jgi:hypothetical protein